MTSVVATQVEQTKHQSPVAHAPVTVFLQEACLQHRYIRSRDTSQIVERPERLRAANIGLVAAIARLEELYNGTGPPTSSSTDVDILADAIENMNIASSSTFNRTSAVVHDAWPVRVVRSAATLDILRHPAVKFIHGDLEGDVYLEKLRTLTRDSLDKVSKGESEIPEGLSQGDLYLCPTSIDAIQGALGTVCEAVDMVVEASRDATTVSPSGRRAFAAIRPPGHHCGEDTPSGFCFVNNVAVGAAHAHIKHGINRVAIFDIDLHHGNGTQSIVWQINEEAYRRKLELDAGAPDHGQAPLHIYYGSVHDILSFPCEDGKLEHVQAASVSIHGPHGQYIENVHLEPYESEEQFWNVLYRDTYMRLITKAREFFEKTGSNTRDTMVFISAGFDASEHEYSSMSRHGRKVPTSFYHRFTRDICAFAESQAGGRIVSVLEGGYSDKAILSGSMAHLVGLADAPGDIIPSEAWWAPGIVDMLANLAKKKRGKASTSLDGAEDLPWFKRAVALLAAIDPMIPNSSSRKVIIPPSTRTLRSKNAKGMQRSGSQITSASGKTHLAAREPFTTETSSSSESSSVDEQSDSLAPVSSGISHEIPQKKIHKVILKLGPRPQNQE